MNIVWQFKTENFEVRLRCEPEEMDPADSFEFPEHIEMVRSGKVEWFCAIVEVLKNGHVVGSDVLGGCAYETWAEFYCSHWNSPTDGRNTLALKAQKRAICHYFPSMVQQAIADARNTCSGLRPV